MEFFAWLEQSALGTWINQSETVLAYPTILLLHTTGLTLLVGTSLTISLRLLGFAPGVPIAELKKLFPLLWAGLGFSTVSGLLLLTAKATTMTVNPSFYVKMVSIALALWAFFSLRRRVFADTVRPDAPLEARDRAVAFASLALWLVAITAGRWMAYVGEATEFASSWRP
jgi:hypothetical protein